MLTTIQIVRPNNFINISNLSSVIDKRFISIIYSCLFKFIYLKNKIRDKHMENFIEREFDNLMKIYIQERMNRHGEMGILYLFQLEDKMDVRFIPVSSELMDPRLREDLSKMNTPSGSNMFICYDNKIMTYDLQKHKK